jgi:hypothetical protein
MVFSQTQRKGGDELGESDSEKCWWQLFMVTMTSTNHRHLKKEVGLRVVGGSEFC